MQLLPLDQLIGYLYKQAGKGNRYTMYMSRLQPKQVLVALKVRFIVQVYRVALPNTKKMNLAVILWIAQYVLKGSFDKKE